MFGRMFNHINLIEKGLDTSWTRQEVISHNIANADTPNYKSKHVEFEEMFRRALQDDMPFDTKVTQNRHLDITNSDPLRVMPQVVTETHHTMRMDGNNVDIDQEMTELAENTIQYNTMVQKANDEFTRLRIAITGTR